MDLGLRDRACVVTGASRGIGRATAVALAREGASVLLVGRREQPLAEAAEQCRQAGGRAETLAARRDRRRRRRARRGGVPGRFERLDALVNNAGTSAVRTLEELTDEDWQAQWELHVMAPMRLMRAAAPVMADRGWGRIVNVCSSSGKRPSSTNMAYSVDQGRRAVAVAGVRRPATPATGVLVNAVTPGPVGDDLWLAPAGWPTRRRRRRA